MRKNKSLVPVDEVEERGEGRFFDKATGEELSQVIAKMSKSLKNVVNPDDIINEYGADTFRMYEMFLGPLEMSKPWNTKGILGLYRFLERVWNLLDKPRKEVKENILISIRDSISDFFIIFQKELDNGGICYKFFPKFSI